MIGIYKGFVYIILKKTYVYVKTCIKIDKT